MESLDKVLCQLGFDQFDEIKPLKDLSSKIGLKPRIILGVSFLVLVLLILLEIGSYFLTSFAGYLYPAYMSFKAIESKEKRDDTQWLTFWIVYTIFSIFDPVLSFVLSFLPFFNLLKLFFFIYLFHPKSRGAETIYNVIIKRLLKLVESHVDSSLGFVEDSLSKAGKTIEGVKQRF